MLKTTMVILKGQFDIALNKLGSHAVSTLTC